MISQQTINQLHDMHLSFLAGDIKERQADASFCELSFDEQITVIVDREWHRRRSKRITDLIREGQFCCNSASVLEIELCTGARTGKKADKRTCGLFLY